MGDMITLQLSWCKQMENNNEGSKSRYEVIKKIGHGGMATVYLAHDRILNRDVALKLLNQDAVSKDGTALKRFLIEAHATTSLIHPNIVEVYDICDVGNKHFIVMEYIEGHTLKETIALRGHIPVKESVWIMKQLCSGIMEAHKNNIIHRDIKPQNVLMKNDGTAKIADFGIAVLNNSFDLTSKDTVLGSVHYLAPELSKGESPTMQSDIYALGIVFFELLIGKVPFTGENAVSIALKHCKESFPDIKKIDPTIPQSIVNIINKATAKEPKDRYENVALMYKDLNDCLSAPNPTNVTSLKHNKHKQKQKPSFSKTIKLDQKPSFATKNNPKLDVKDKFTFSDFILILFVLISISSVLFIFLLTGVINFGANSEVKVPDVLDMNINDASDFLLDYGISIDTANIERKFSDTVPANTIMETVPEAGARVDKGSKLSVVVSDGPYAVLGDFIGKNIADVSAKLLNTKVIINKKVVESNKKPGTIVRQEPDAGYKYNPNEILEVTIEYSKINSIEIDNSYKGMNIDEAYNDLVSKGINVEIVNLQKDKVSEEQLAAFGPKTLMYSEPALGSMYTQDSTSVLKIFCYGNAENNDEESGEE